MAFPPFVSSGDLIQRSSTRYFAKPAISPSSTNDYPRPVTISFAGNNSNCQQEDTIFNIGQNSKPG